jgi:hypothetical protein
VREGSELGSELVGAWWQWWLVCSGEQEMMIFHVSYRLSFFLL